MPISPLPPAAARQLGSALVITTPVDVVKELLDNALDSGATSVEVLVSPNTVDEIVLRDDGHGVHPDDFDLLGRPGHTSKLKTLDELSIVGARSLGFRGVALSSINTLAKVSVTTRMFGEPVAAALHLSDVGGVAKQLPSPAPVGTTVSVTDLFSRYPVRRQAAIKGAPKTLAKIKELLYAYKLARPAIRLSFKVSKQANFSYLHAQKTATVKEAVMQLFGTELTSSCIFMDFSAHMEARVSDEDNVLDSAHREHPGPVFEAVLPRSDANPHRVAKGAFISVDSRPLSSTRGFAKRIYSAFKSQLARAILRPDSKETLKDPFIRLNIICPPRSYDPNVEPSKDNVLFTDEDSLFDQFKSFLSTAYPVSRDGYETAPEGKLGAAVLRPHSCAASDPSASSSSTQEPNQTRICISSGPGTRSIAGQPASSTCSNSEAGQRGISAQPFRVDMSSAPQELTDDDSEDNGRNDISSTVRSDYGTEEIRDCHNDGIIGSSLEGLNPFVLAKLAAPRRLADPAMVEAAQRPVAETRTPEPEVSSENPGHNLSAMMPRRTLRTPDFPQTQRRDDSTHVAIPPCSVPGGAYRRPISRQTTFPTNLALRQSTNRHGLAPRSPPSSPTVVEEPRRPLPTGRPYLSGRAGRGGLAQTKISFNNKRGMRGQGRTTDINHNYQASSGFANASGALQSRRATGTNSMTQNTAISSSTHGFMPAPVPQHRPPPLPMPSRLGVSGHAHKAAAGSSNAEDSEFLGRSLRMGPARADLVKTWLSRAQPSLKKSDRVTVNPSAPGSIPRWVEARDFEAEMRTSIDGLARQLDKASYFDKSVVNRDVEYCCDFSLDPADRATIEASLPKCLEDHDCSINPDSHASLKGLIEWYHCRD
ncbi:hypothetical protein QBC46DRAFT_429145 [Diplogelasinospora grovesii]|uniref:DNA mismatch repair protein S5 domain-containing protein n=1 Tax=Diplogelasinospora grovesii TaxID=303347 RepID=A0AAN6S632_9PEZI|nr:hypothetical protein QBC46DRAFT_429145 [Diplogelasinospora grovesii]